MYAVRARLILCCAELALLGYLVFYLRVLAVIPITEFRGGIALGLMNGITKYEFVLRSSGGRDFEVVVW